MTTRLVNIGFSATCANGLTGRAQASGGTAMQQTSMCNVIGTMVSVVMAMTACDQAPNRVTAPPAATVSVASRGVVGRCQTTYVVTDRVFLPPPNDGVLVQLSATHVGTCEMGHLGRTGLVKVETVTFDQTGGHVRDARATFTAANGDQLFGTESAELGTLDENGTFPFTGSWTFNGGTGRFANAAGLVVWTGSGSILTNTTERSFEGWISY